jgi:hypothetical protein
LCWPSLGATLRTRTPSPILTGVRVCGTSPNSWSLACWTRHLRVGEHLRVIVDPTARHPGCFEDLDPVVGGLGRQHRVHQGLQRIAVGYAYLVGRKTRVLAPFRVPQHLGTTRPDRSPAVPTIKYPSLVCAGRARSGDGATLGGSAPRGRRAIVLRRDSGLSAPYCRCSVLLSRAGHRRARFRCYDATF